ncbi:MAG: type I restriction-modification system subunit M [Sulfuricurvum sp.]|nr:type I restriction-modification system subunit M [Sulfuricurvum sp.]
MGKITLQELESHLWGAANILRGKIDSSDYKTYIFGLLFFKRISDVWQEEYEDRLAKYKNREMAADPEEHRFHIPKKCFWGDIRKHSTDIGAELNKAFHAIEDANTRLKGIFQDVDFNNKDRFPDSVLEKLLQHFDKYPLRNENVDGDILGNAYEYLIKQFADDAGKKGGEFYTPKQVVRLLVEILKPEEGMSIYDGACGSGGMLLECSSYLKRNKKNPKSIRLYGQEINLNTWAICRINLFLHDIDDAFVERGDTLRNPKHLIGDGKVLQTFDRVIANPPFSLKEWGFDEWSKGDPYGRSEYGVPPKGYGDLAFVEHFIWSLNDKGMLGVVLPHGVLFRGGAEGQIRTRMIQDDLIEAVIGLAPNLFYGASIPACLLIVNKKKKPDHRGKILIINAAGEYIADKAKNSLSDENVAKVVSAFKAYENVERFARVVEVKEIEDNDYNLNLTRYVQTNEEEAPIDVSAEWKTLQKLITKRDEAEAKMKEFIKELGY